MTESYTTAKVLTIPNCDLCKAGSTGTEVPAKYDARLWDGHWGFLCQDHFDQHGVGLGMGKGQELILDA